MYKRKYSKFFIYSLASLLISTFLSFIYIFFPNLLNSFDNRLRDSYFLYKGDTATSNSVLIVDIDEPSLKEFGQWPWSRNILAKIIDNLTDAGVVSISMDIVFAEEDRTSPSKIANIVKTDLVLEDYDEVFANSIAKSPVILGYSFDFENSKSSNPPDIPVIFIEKNKPDKNYVLEANGATINIPMIQDISNRSGFFNIVPDESGVIRNVPLIISYNDSLYPSLSLETIRAIYGIKQIRVNYDENGVSNIELGNLKIPTDISGRLFINYRGGSKTFQYISAKDIYYNDFKKEDINGKIALLGTSAIGLYDLRATPYENTFPGVEIHANVIDNLLQCDLLQKPSYFEGLHIFLIYSLVIIVFFAISFSPFILRPFIFIIFLLTYLIVSYKILFEYGYVLNIIFPLLSIIFAFVSSLIVDFFYNIKQEKAIKNKFASKVSKTVMDDILNNLDKNEFSAKSKEITIFFSDVRDFTNISEKLSPEELIKYLNNYMEPMSEIIIKYQGTIDKFIGDAIMAYWNAPIDIENHADKALKSAILQIKHLDILNKDLEEKNLPKIDIGIGLNSGEVIVGEMGSKSRSDYTVIGDTINLGSRVESLCKYYNSKINITNYTKQLLKDEYVFRFLDYVRVKGKNKPVEIWQVYDFGTAINEQRQELEQHHKAIELYKNSEFKKALEIFENLENSSQKTNKNIYKIYINRCEEYIKKPPFNFDGVYEHNTK